MIRIIRWTIIFAISPCTPAYDDPMSIGHIGVNVVEMPAPIAQVIEGKATDENGVVVPDCTDTVTESCIATADPSAQWDTPDQARAHDDAIIARSMNDVEPAAGETK